MRNVLLIGSALLLIACDGDRSPGQASRSDYVAALQSWYDTHPECVSLVRNGGLPIERSPNDTVDQAAIEAAVSAGLLNASPLGGGRTQYAPTATGEDALREGDAFLGGVDLCYAKRSIEEVIESTDAAPGGVGLSVTKVTYRYSLDPSGSWVTAPEITAAFPAILERLSEPPSTDVANLVRTDRGWVYERALEQR